MMTIEENTKSALHGRLSKNRMNDDINKHELSKYLDQKFFNAVPEPEDEQIADVVAPKREEKEKLPVKLEPREYQYELYQKALRENVIVVLDTGMGKTLISTMLIKSMISKERQARLGRDKSVKPKLAFFIVDRVPLVFQQASVIRTNCEVELKELCGEMNVDKMSKDVWGAIFDSNDMCVLTAQILLDCLRRGFLTMDRVHLLIFDECHHATKKHPFNLILKEFYFKQVESERPKVFGMTASPISGQKNVELGIMKLEKNLNSRVYTASNLNELNAKMNRPEEMLLYYSPPKTYCNTILTRQLSSVLVPYEDYNDSCFKNIKHVLCHLGPWCSDRMWEVILLSMKQKSTSNLQIFAKMDMNVLGLAIETIQGICNHIDRNPDTSNTAYFTPKAHKLIHTLKELVQTLRNEFRGIIFVERRFTAIAIHTLVTFLDCFSGLRIGLLLGHGNAANDHVKMNFKQQNRVVDSFKKGEIDLLVATNVAEEGLDIQPCNVVIRFDFVQTVIAHIQSRGRARKKSSRYIIMLEENNADQTQLLHTFMRSEQRMKEFCRILPSERNVANSFLQGFDKNDDKELCIEKTGAKLIEQNAVALVYQYCSSLRSDEYCELRPLFEIMESSKGVKCKLTMPNNAIIRIVESPWTVSKNKAKTLAAFEACTLLLEKKGLDGHLRPRNWRSKADCKQQMALKDEKGLVIGSKDRQLFYPRKTPDVWRVETCMDSDELFCRISLLKIKVPDALLRDGQYRDLCLITRKPLPTIPTPRLMYEGGTFEVLVKSHSDICVRLDSHKAMLLSNYMLEITKEVVDDNVFCETAHEVPYYIAPLVKNSGRANEENTSASILESLIDWEEINRTVKTAQEDCISIDDDIYDSVVIDFNNSRRSVHENTASPFKENTVLQLKKLNKHMNFLNRYCKAKIKTVDGIGRQALYSCKRHPISASVYRSLMLVPSLMTRIESMLLVKELKTRFEFCINDNRLLEAMTAVSANLDVNYERLEILGDSVLKIVATTCLFSENLLSDENELTYLRTQIISNVSLFGLAYECELYSYMTTEAFEPRHWRPRGFKRHNDTEEVNRYLNYQQISDKTMADLVEAILGAAYLEYGLEGGLDAALKLGFPFKGMNDPSEASEDNFKTYAMSTSLAEELSSVDLPSIEKTLGYQFKKPFLLVEALTHASYLAPNVSCYQRLEFLGDAVLDILVTHYVYEKYPNADQGVIHTIKSACVNNNLLSTICVERRIYKHIRHCSGQLLQIIEDFKNAVESKKPTENAPKVLADVVESLLGAVFVDAGFQLQPCKQIFDKWFIPSIKSYVSTEMLKIDSSIKLANIFKSFGCTSYNYRNYSTQETGPESQSCVMFLHGSPLASGSCWDLRSARKKAADNALQRLSENTSLLLSACDCKE